MKPLADASIKQLLKTKALGKTIYSFEEVGSTNEIASELAKNGAPEGTIVISDSQTQGKGRLKRKWISPHGVNLYMSVILRPQVAPKDSPLLTFVASIAVIEAIRAEGVEAFVKWPNDTLIGGKKTAGILTEMEIENDKVLFAIVGIGVNLNMTDEGIEEMGEVAATATSVRKALGHEVDRLKFTASLIGEFEAWYQRFIRGERSRIIKEWTERWRDFNRRLQVNLGEKVVEGVASGVDENGYLLLKKDDGTIEKIISGDVIFSR